MGFLGVYKALYDYSPQAEGELSINEGDLLFIFDKQGDDGWWKAKKKAKAEDDDEPEGLIPNNYVEEAPVVSRARALYEYTRQTDEELSFPDDAILEIYDTTDPDWILAGYDNEFGFVPSNYIDAPDAADAADTDGDALATLPPPSLPQRPRPAPTEINETVISPRSPVSSPAAALANVLGSRATPPPRQKSVQFESPSSESEPVRSPTLPSRPRPQSYDDYGTPVAKEETERETFRTPGGFHMYNINEMVSVMGKRKKMPTTLGINLATGVILIAPERASDGPSQEWTAEKMTHYSREGKHVFMELVRPSKSVDFHAGAKDTAEEIVGALGEMAGAVKAEGLREVIEAGTGGGKNIRKGVSLYDFMAQGDDEVTVAAGDEIIILDDSKSDEWWQVRRLKNGKEGVIPSSYIEITGTITPPPDSVDVLRATVEANRQEEIRLTKEALKASKQQEKVGPGAFPPNRNSSLAAQEIVSNSGKQRSKRENGRADGSNGQSKSKSKPDASKVRNWTDRSKSFSVEAQFLGLKDGKIHLHKMNGVKIAVPVAKMSHEDLQYVEAMTGISLDDERPLADMRKSKASDKKELQSGASKAGATIEPKKPEYDWFQFFLNCDVAVGLCDRYAQAFNRDSIDESVLPDVDSSVLRNLGLREGDIIKVMRHLDDKFGRKKGTEPEGEAGLFSGPGGMLRNNTRKGRPAPTVQTNDTIDAAVLSTKKDSPTATKDGTVSPRLRSPSRSISPPQHPTGGFDDDAWNVKPTKQSQIPVKETSNPSPEPTKATSPPPQAGSSMQELSLLTQPLEPTRTAASPPQAILAEQQLPLRSSPAQPTGTTPASFSNAPSGNLGQYGQNGSFLPPQNVRQRPTPPALNGATGLMPAPPPQRALSAPLPVPQGITPPGMAPQMTGVQGQPAMAGESLNDLTQARLQQQYTAQMQNQQPMMTGYQPQGINTFPGVQQQMMQPMQSMVTGLPMGGPFADPRTQQFSPMQAQPTGFQSQFPPPNQAFGQVQGPINNYLPPALEPQRTSFSPMQAQPTGMGIYSQQQPQPPVQPLMPQKTGPAPPVRFGVNPETKKLAPQPTGRRANLAQATPQNPFGFE